MKVKRLVAFYLDLMLIGIIGAVLFDIVNDSIVICLVSLLIKDLVFKNQSIGKRILKLEVRSSDGKKASLLQIMFRNITLIIWPIEFIFFLINNKRIGDIVFKTIVVEK